MLRNKGHSYRVFHHLLVSHSLNKHTSGNYLACLLYINGNNCSIREFQYRWIVLCIMLWNQKWLTSTNGCELAKTFNYNDYRRKQLQHGEFLFFSVNSLQFNSHQELFSTRCIWLMGKLWLWAHLVYILRTHTIQQTISGLKPGVYTQLRFVSDVTNKHFRSLPISANVDRSGWFRGLP